MIRNPTPPSGPSCRAWLERGRAHRCPPEPDPDDWPGRRAHDADLAAAAVRRRVRGHQLAGRVRRPGRHPRRAPHLPRGGRPRRRSRRRRRASSGQMHAGPTLIAEGRPEQQAHHLRGHPHRRARLVPGLLRARGRLATSPACAPARCATATTTSSPARRSGPRTPGRRLLRAAGAHRPRRPQAQGHHLADRADGPPRHRGAPARHHPGLHRVRRAVPRRGPDPGRQPGRRRERRLAGRQRHPQLRAGHGLRGRDARDHQPDARRWSASPRRPPEGVGHGLGRRRVRRDLGAIAAELDALWAFTKRNVRAGAKGGAADLGSGSAFKLAYAGVVRRAGRPRPRRARPGRARHGRHRRPAHRRPGARQAARLRGVDSAAAPPRSSRTSSPSGCSACPGSAEPWTSPSPTTSVALQRDDLPLRRRPLPDIEVVRAFGEPGGFDRAAWAELAELGTFGIAVPEDRRRGGPRRHRRRARPRGPRRRPGARARWWRPRSPPASSTGCSTARVVPAVRRASRPRPDRWSSTSATPTCCSWSTTTASPGSTPPRLDGTLVAHPTDPVTPVTRLDAAARR